MEKVKISRAFTPYQHHQTVMELEKFVTENTEILALPNITSLYIEDQLNPKEAEELFRETWQKIQELWQKYNLKVIVSVQQQDQSQLEFKVRTDPNNKINIRDTSEGLKYCSKDFETFFYNQECFVQTTIPYWDEELQNVAKIKVSR